MSLARGSSKLITVNLTTSAGIYAAGDVIDSVKTLTDAVLDPKGTALLHSLVLIDKINQKVSLDLLFFDTAPTVGADNAAAAITDAHMAYCIGRVSIVNSEYVTVDGSNLNAEVTKTGLALLLQSTAGKKDLYMVAVSRGTPTYGSAAVNLVVKLGLIQD